MQKPTKSGDDNQAKTGGLELDHAGLDAARSNLENGSMTPAYGRYREEVIKLLNGALATELTCVLRYRRHHFTAHGVSSPKIAEEFMVHANAELGHADRIAERIVQLGGEPEFSPQGMLERGHAGYDEPKDLTAMIRSNLVAERVAVEAYRQMITLLGDKDSTTRRMLEDILADEEEHADELKDWLEK